MIAMATILLISAFLMGYCYGKYSGKQYGYKAGMADSPLLLRQQSMEQGWCVICGKGKNTSD